MPRIKLDIKRPLPDFSGPAEPASPTASELQRYSPQRGFERFETLLQNARHEFSMLWRERARLEKERSRLEQELAILSQYQGSQCHGSQYQGSQGPGSAGEENALTASWHSAGANSASTYRSTVAGGEGGYNTALPADATLPPETASGASLSLQGASPVNRPFWATRRTVSFNFDEDIGRNMLFGASPMGSPSEWRHNDLKGDNLSESEARSELGTEGGHEDGQSEEDGMNLHTPSLLVSKRTTKAAKRETFCDESVAEARKKWVVSPADPGRLIWDLVCFVLILYEVWAFPFETLFVKDDHPGFMAAYWAITAFFCVDIVLNFNTGYIDKGRFTKDRCKIARHYLRGHFWLDLIGTIPLDVIFANVPLRFSFMRGFKTTRLLKTIRYVRLSHMVQRLQHLRRAGVFRSHDHSMFRAIMTSVALVLLAHIHACVWVLLRPDWVVPATLENGLRAYLHALKEAVAALFAGAGLEPADTPSLWLFSMVIAVEQLLLRVCFVSWAVFTANVNFEESSQMALRNRATLRYLRQHNVSTAAQIQVFFGLHDLGSAKLMQRRFNNLIENDLPENLRRTILRELWDTKLKTHGLINLVHGWKNGFVGELALACREEVFPSHAQIFKSGDLSFAAYYLLGGTVVIESKYVTLPVFTPLMWLGEKALVNPWAKRDTSAVAREICRCMNVPSERFYDLLDKFEVTDAFRRWCQEQLWRGICGRCGAVADHFPNQCPLMNRKTLYSSRQLNGRKKPSCANRVSCWIPRRFWDFVAWISAGDGGHEGEEGMNHKELEDFLSANSCQRVLDALQELGIFTLEDLDRAGLAGSGAMERLIDDYNLSERELDAILHPDIEDFRRLRAIRDMQAEVNELLVPNQDKEHFLFLSHFKLEAGTEAALMQSELETMINEEENHPLSKYRAPVFLDTEDLGNLNELRYRVQMSQCLVLLLTKGVLTRPWCLIEIVTAIQLQIPVLPVQIVKPGAEFHYPDRTFYEELRAGVNLEHKDQDLLTHCGMTLDDVTEAVHEVFKHIAVRFSPHSPANMRRVELETIMQRCLQSGTGRHHLISSSDYHVPKSMPHGGRPSLQRRNSKRLTLRDALNNFFSSAGSGQTNRSDRP